MRMPAAELHQVVAPPGLNLAGDRITSYNVCYTKLLRFAICSDLGLQLVEKRITRDEAALKAWMVSIMSHCWLDHLRRRRSYNFV